MGVTSRTNTGGGCEAGVTSRTNTGGGCEAGVTSRTELGWAKFRKCRITFRKIFL